MVSYLSAMRARFLVLALVLLVAPLYASGPGAPLGPVHYASRCEAQQSRIASNGRTFFGAWTFVHSGLAFVSGSIAGGSIDEGGALMTPTQHTIAGLASEAVASDGTGYLVATNDSGTINARIADADGLSQSSPIPLAAGYPSSSITGSGIHSSVGVAWNGNHYVVIGTTATKDTGQSIHESLLAATITADGQVAGTRVIADSAQLLDLEPAGNGRTLVLMLAGDTTQSMLIDDSLVTTAPMNVVKRGNVRVDVVSNGSGFLAVWSAGTSVEAIALDVNGIPTAAPFVVGSFEDIGVPMPPAVAWDGSSYLIVWWSGNLVAARSNGSGATPPFGISGSAYYPSVATNAAGDAMVLFTNGCGTISSRVVRRGAMAPEAAEHALSLDAVPQAIPTAVRVAEGTQVVWEEYGASGAAIFSSFVTSDGTVGPLHQLTEDGSYSSGTATLMPLASGTAVVWNELRAGVTGGLRLQRFDRTGNPVAVPLRIGAGQAFSLAAAANGTDVGIAFTQDVSSLFASDAYVAVVDSAGNVHQTLLSETFSANATITPLGDGFLVVWRENGAAGTPLYSALVDRNANVVTKQLILADSHGPFQTALVSTPEGALLAWSVSSVGASTLTALRLDGSGAPQGTPFQLATSPNVFLHIRMAVEAGAIHITYLTSNGSSAPWEVRRTTLLGGPSVPVTLVSSEAGETIEEYTLSGGRVAGVVVARSDVDPATNGAARLFWRPLALSHPRAVGR